MPSVPRSVARVPRRAGARLLAGAPLVGVLLLAACSPSTEGEVTLTVEHVGGSATAAARVVDPGTGEVVDTREAEERLRLTHRADGAFRIATGADGPSVRSGLAPVLDRAVLEQQVTRRLSCDGGDLRIASQDAVEVSGRCATLTVTGAGARVVAGDVDRLVVQGAGARVVVASVDVVVVDAAGVRVAWEGGIPEVSSSTGDGAGYGPVGVVRLDAG